ncbi:hypothetical protein [Aurantimonas coralicida]|uniref:phage adaptor protein n=1 Tax=Aurantimonas coralicida TaxID=182270 RepID=UPI001E51BD20|nr:hypothetical protein [Aurantimonas coralicida]MCD1644157.1 hypothetical protein [Aurantimonas coralicida]
MALSNYSDLKTALAAYLIRNGDEDFEGRTPEFIAMAESQLNRRLILRVMETTVPLTGTTGEAHIDLPPDYVEPIALHLTTYGTADELRPDVSGDMPYSLENGSPQGWAIDGETIRLDCPCDQAHTFTFRYRKSFALSDGSPTNWLLTNHPDAYLAASLGWGAAFALDDPSLARWKALAEESISEIAWQQSRSERGTLRVDPSLAGRGSFNIISG